MPIELPPQYDPKSVEKAIYQKWLDAKAFHAVPDARPPEKRYSIVIPPPNVTGALHLGHAINGTIQDVLARYHRMLGDNTLWMPGIDHAGIATQAVVEKTIFEKEKKNRHDLGREELVRRIWEWKEQFGTRILSQLASIGSSCDWERTRFTLDDVCARAVREAFFKMFKDGLIFRGKRLVNWDTHLQTAVADDEIYHEAVKGQMTSIRYPVAVENAERGTMNDESGSAFSVQNSEFLVVATTRPETMLGDTAVAVHPDDPRYTHLHGKFVIVPLVGRRIPVVCDGLLVDPKFGTGVVKVTPAHDPNDYATGVRHGLEQINLLTADGKVNENGAGEFLGRKYSYVGLKFATAARKQVLADLEALGLIAETKVHEHEVGHSDRSKTPIEPYLSDQWFVRMGDIGAGDPPKGGTPNGVTLANGTRAPGLAQAAMDAVTSGRVRITPERYAKGYLDWLGQKRDWCISRQLWWGHRIPVWTKAVEVGPTFLDDARADRGGNAILWKKEGDLLSDNGIEWGFARGQVNLETGQAYHTICVRHADDEIVRHLEKEGYVQDPDVLDTWFSSALWPISTMGWPANGTSDKPEDQLLPYFYPTSLLSTAREILTLWVARMVIFGLYCKGDVPFRDVYIHAIIQDGEGRPMKKTLGNGVDPVDIVHSHGADALRFTLASMATETQDIRLPVQLVCPHCHERIPNNINGPVVIGCPKCKQQLTRPVQTAVGTEQAPMAHSTSDRFDLGRNFANKIWNASRFILSNLDANTKSLDFQAALAIVESSASLEVDRWILQKLISATEAVRGVIDPEDRNDPRKYNFALMAQHVYQFFWGHLCDGYIELSKRRLRSGDSEVQSILFFCLEQSLVLLHPIMPFVTEKLWENLPRRETLLINARWPLAVTLEFETRARKATLKDNVTVFIELLGEIVNAIRDLNNRYPSSKGRDIVLSPNTQFTYDLVLRAKPDIEHLVNAKLSQIAIQAHKPSDACVAVLADLQIFIGGVIDKSAETAKLTKRQAELEKLIPAGRFKLANEAAIAKAPPKVVQGWRDQLTKQEEELATIEKNLAELQS